MSGERLGTYPLVRYIKLHNTKCLEARKSDV